MTEENAVAVPAKFEKIVSEIEQMSVLDLNELVEVFEAKFGVSATAVAAAGPAAGNGEAAEEKSTANVELTDGGANKIAVIKGSHLFINPNAVGYDICAFIGIYLEKGSAYQSAVTKMRQVPEIVEMHYTTGQWSMFAKIICRDTLHLREVLNEKIQAIEGVERTETFISLEESITRQVDIL